MNLRFTGRTVTLAALALLGFWLLVWLAFLTQAGRQERIIWLVLALLPLVIVTCLVTLNFKSGFVWCGFISLGYFAQGITVTLTSKSDSVFGAVEIFLSLLLFTAVSAVLRAQRRHRLG
ncbi:MAG: DUF2069 domain-containing protein, partial [Gammaproteobacteria bacterium]